MRSALFFSILLLTNLIAPASWAMSDQTADQSSQVWAVLIGVSRYQLGDQSNGGNRIPNLKNAADDARELYDFLRSDERGGFRDLKEGGHMVLLTDEQANRAN